MSLNVYYNDFEYQKLKDIRYLKRGGKMRTKKRATYNISFIGADTETSKKPNKVDNHICAFSVAIRADHNNIICLYGNNPMQFIHCIKLLRENLRGDNIFIYFHNLAYDYMFLRKFLLLAFGEPKKQLNTKSHYPIYIEYECGIIFRDSLILAQRKLEKWANDLNVEHKKAVGNWDYDLIRNQDHIFSDDEIVYICNDVWALVECLDKTADMLNKHVATMPWTATGIVREKARKIGAKNGAHNSFLKIAPTFEQQQKLEKIYHGGYTHGNRYYYDRTITGEIVALDFTSSYPFVMLSNKYPMSKFMPINNKSLNDIISLSDKYAFMFKLILIGVSLKDHFTPMPILQFSKCVKIINPIVDNGRILYADYIEIYVNEIDAKLINNQYNFIKHICTEVEFSVKKYLPRWFTDMIFSLFEDKTKLKNKDPILYQLSKGMLNSCYGMCCQKPLKDEIVEEYISGEYTNKPKINEEEYNKYLNKRGSILPYFWGVWVTSYALNNLFKLGECVDYENGGEWIYSDTDSIYATKWNDKKVNAYNNHCIEKLKANNYDSLEFEDNIYTLGVACVDSVSTEYRFTGAKRYCKRDKMNGELKITVAGVPKKGAACLNNDINNFTNGFCFDGKSTGKLLHTYIYADDIYTDAAGNITGDSINLSSCDYILGAEINANEIEIDIPIYTDD